MADSDRINKEVLNPQEAAEYIRISKTTLYKLLRTGEIPATKFGNQWRISKTVLDEFLRGGRKK